MQKPQLSKLSITQSNIKYKTSRINTHSTPEANTDELHMHNCYEVYINTSGDISYFINDTLYKIKNGDMVFVRPYDLHMCIVNSPCVHESFCMWFKCNFPQLQKFVERDDFVPVYSLGEMDINCIFGNLGCLQEAETIDNEVAKATCFFNVLNVILAQKKGTECYESAKFVKIPSEMQKVLDYINEKYTQIEYISEIVDNTYVSTTTLSRWFKKYLHTTPREYLRSKKLAYARKLLDEGETVTGACMASGFSDCSYFISIFKKKYGVTPAKYSKPDTPDELE
ncbi:MAG: helix-turn-helix domain-containing protein [Ruminococcaceae bacterium]|nr:helix-turn-helix domain-containing protein [Oscillospiraceae bacterium]